MLMITKAVRCAAEWHAGQMRKGAIPTPYFCHLAEVAELVAEATGGLDQELVAAAYLHDAMEDAGKTFHEIRELFGIEVAELVAEVSDNKALPYAERKRRQIDHANLLSGGAKTIKLADKIANLNSLAKDPPVGWDKERRLAYVAWARAVVEAMGKMISPYLLDKFNAAATLMEEKETVS